MDEVKQAFQQCDRDGDGYISVTEAHKILHAQLGFSEADTGRLVAVYDRNGDGRLSFEEFIWFYWKIQEKRDELRRLFSRFDTDKSQSISYDEAREILRDLRLPHTDSELRQLLSNCDHDQDGHLQFDEFVHFWTAIGGKVPGKN